MRCENPECCVQFYPTRPHQRYCSERCRRETHRRRYREGSDEYHLVEALREWFNAGGNYPATIKLHQACERAWKK